MRSIFCILGIVGLAACGAAADRHAVQGPSFARGGIPGAPDGGGKRVKCVSDFVTGGGWIATATAADSFGVGGGTRRGEFWGHLTYTVGSDSAAGIVGYTVEGTAVTGYTVVDSVTRTITGEGLIDELEFVTYTVTVSDSGEPGTADTFAITLSNGYTASGTLGGGNIQLHSKGFCS